MLFPYQGIQWTLLQNNAIYGPIPVQLGSWRSFRHLISPTIISMVKCPVLEELSPTLACARRLNNNSLIGAIPESLSEVEGLTLVELSFNNLSGSLTKISARTFKPDGTKKAYVQLTPDYDALDVANKIGII